MLNSPLHSGIWSGLGMHRLYAWECMSSMHRHAHVKAWACTGYRHGHARVICMVMHGFYAWVCMGSMYATQLLTASGLVFILLQSTNKINK